MSALAMPLGLRLAIYGNISSENRLLDSIPELPSTATAEDVADALAGSKDTSLVENITSAEMYNNYREWALSVKDSTRVDIAGTEAVKASPNAWLSFALDSSFLIANEPVDGDVVIDSFEKGSSDGIFEFTVSIDDIDVGGGAIEENIKKIFEIEGTANLSSAFSSASVELSAASPENGKVKFTVAPVDKTAKSFFFKAKMR